MKHVQEDVGSGGKPSLSVYVHWPYCQSKCPYCDFNSHVATFVDHDAWLAAYLIELRHAAKRIPERRVPSVFFGGGTPSLMRAETVAAVINEIDHLWGLEPEAEITLEANPGSVEIGTFAEFRLAGVNRISIGAQSLRDDDLRRLGRQHSADDIRRAINIAQGHFDRISIDLIYARQFQSVAAWEAELVEALSIGLDHLSLYQLTLEPGTVFERRNAVGSLPGLPDDDLAVELFDLTQDMCEAAGVPAYEVSNHARPGQECRHNITYWRCGDYLGVGPGAHGRTTIDGIRFAEVSPKAPGQWLQRLRSAGSAIECVPLALPELASEHLLMGLRASEGISLARHAELRGQSLDSAKLAYLQSLGLITLDGDTLGATRNGRLLLNSVISELDA